MTLPYNITITDSGNRIDGVAEQKIEDAAAYIMDLLERYMDWEGELDIEVDIRPDSESTNPGLDGSMKCSPQFRYDSENSVFFNATLEECLTGIDSDTNDPDAKITIYLAEDGALKVDGFPLWFDPNPEFDVTPAVPSDKADFIGIFTHEIFHALGFIAGTDQFDQHFTTIGGVPYFSGTRTSAVYGGPVPFDGTTSHYTNSSVPGSASGLMFSAGQYNANRLDIGLLDLAILADLGHNIVSYEGLPLTDLYDPDPNISGTSNADLLRGDYQDNILRGNEDNDTFIGNGGADAYEGYTGDDTFIVQDSTDIIVEFVTWGDDVIRAQVSYVLADNVSVETMLAYDVNGTTVLNLTGNNFDNAIVGNAGANVLDGNGGADVLIGMGGNDIYVVDAAGDVVTEANGEGSDLIYTSADYTLAGGSEVEALLSRDNSLTVAMALIGNGIANTILGNNGANYLDGDAGADVLAGYGGNDVYVIDNGADQLFEGASGGTDAAYTTVNFALPAGEQIEVLASRDNSLSGAMNLTGNEFANTILGNNGTNIIDGKGGADALAGYGGADTFAFTTALGGGNVDFIDGFATGTDKIALDDAIFTAIGSPGALNANAFVAGTAAADASDRIIYNAATGQIFYDADGNGGGAAVLFATIAISTSLAGSDFQVI